MTERVAGHRTRSGGTWMRPVFAVLVLVAMGFSVAFGASALAAKSKTVSPKAYVHSYCAARNDLGNGFKEANDALNAQTTTDSAAAKVQFGTYLSTVIPHLQHAIGQLQHAGVPKVTGGAGIAAYLPRQLGLIRDNLATLQRKLSALAADDPSLPQAVHSIAINVETQNIFLARQFEVLQTQMFPKAGKLSPALAHDPSCAA